MDNLLEKRKDKFEQLRIRRMQQRSSLSESNIEGSGAANQLKPIPELFVECPTCHKEFTKRNLRENLYVCPECGYHYAMPPEKRILSLCDEGTFKRFRYHFPEIDPLQFEGYTEKRAALREKTRQEEAVLTGVGKIEGKKAVIAVMNSKFLMGSMGIQLGETVTLAVEYAEKNKLPLIIFTASGGARMQEGILSLMQMAKTSAAIERFQKKGGLYIAYFTHPTTGGVSASFAGLGDITLAEPKALVGFAGPRVIEQTIGQKLPEGFQRSEYLEEHGFVDQIVPRSRMRQVISQILMLHQK